MPVGIISLMLHTFLPAVATVDHRQEPVVPPPNLADASPETRALLMASDSRVSGRAARAAGAYGFVPKHWPAQDIANAARMVGLGMTVFAPDTEMEPAMLSERERQVLEMIASGSTN